MKKYFLFGVLGILLFSCSTSSTEVSKQLQCVTFVDSILATMSLEEKIGQMTQINITQLLQDSIVANYNEATRPIIDTQKVKHWVSTYHIGSFLNGRGFSADDWYNYAEALQRINLKHSNIPIIYGVDHVHGSSYLKEGTIFPHNINIANTFDTLFSYQGAQVVVEETRNLGHHWIFAPVLGIGKQKLWGRYYETYGEDPFLVTQMGIAHVNGIQQSGNTAACAKHFIGYSDPKSGWDRSPAEIPEQHLREFFLPSFRAAISAGAKTIMINSGEVNGIPVHASYELLTKLLRKELGFEGVAVTDWLDIIALEKMHHVAENEKEATYLAIKAGVDMSMVPEDSSFCIYLKELVLEGRISEARIDSSVRRILQLKKDLGLFEKPYPSLEYKKQINKPENREKALNAAHESIVLLKNKNHILPLSKTTKIALGGINANAKAALCGGWTYRFAADGDRWFPDTMQTLYDGLKKEFPSVKLIDQDQGASFNGNHDVIVLALGESLPYAETQGTIDDLTLEKSQRETIDGALKTGKPVVLILIEGRPRNIGDYADKVAAIVFAGLPGKEGAQAISEIISGKVNPSGKMSFTYPKSHGHIISYNHKPSEYSPLREVSDELKYYSIGGFGEGLSYTDFEYSDIEGDTLVKGKNETIKFSVIVTNKGNRTGKEAVLWYISDESASITRPVKCLRQFEKKEIQVDKSIEFSFIINPLEDLSFPDKNGNIRLEEGWFTLNVGGHKKRFYYSE